MARIGDDDCEKVTKEATNILLAWNDVFQDEGSESSESASEGSSASSTFCDLEKDYSKVSVFVRLEQSLIKGDDTSNT